MFWDRAAGVYDVFVNVINGQTHRKLRKIVADQFAPGDTVPKCACGTGLLTADITALSYPEGSSTPWGKPARFQTAVYVGELPAVLPGRRLAGCADHAGGGPHPLRGGDHKQTFA